MNRTAEPLSLDGQLRALGYDVPDDGSFAAWRADVLRRADRYDRPDGGTTWVASGRSAAAIAVFDDAHGATLRIVPFVFAGAACTVVYGGVGADVGTDATGSGTVAISVLGADPMGAAVSLSMWTPHMAAWAAATPPGGMLDVAIGAVGDDVETVPVTAEPFRTVGPDGFARICGRVDGHLLHHNDVTRRPFETAVVDCGGVAVTVAVDPTRLRRPFSVGETIALTARICGPILRHAG